MELLKYDARRWMLPFTLLLYVRARFSRMRGRYSCYGQQLSSLFRTGWAGSAWLVTGECRRLFSTDNPVGRALSRQTIDATQPLSNTRKFFDDPTQLFEGVVIILKAATATEKGVLLVKYSYYFSLLFKLFDVEELARHYHLVLEPSWAGYADPGILCYAHLREPVFVMTYEGRDRDFIQRLGANLVPVDIGPSWWVDHRMFRPLPEIAKRFDLIMVAAWDPFKRHHALFRALRQLARRGRPIQVALAGYSTTTNAERILELADYYGVRSSLTIFDKVPPNQVADLFRQSRLNLLWSRFEGNNRAIIEGMFCDVPVIVRAGHNYGEHYFYINDETGRFATEAELPDTIMAMLDQAERFEPRAFVGEWLSCERATEVLAGVIAEHDPNWQGELAIKVNELDGMRYAETDASARFEADYRFLISMVRCSSTN
ncbi:glycosyltransferase [Marinobacter changyiensis]|uniref:glycosyltransferase n=1 Tax=Marinobacter changyiensis TaxID=2604091 RepID=UPI0015D18FD9|nr:glycosyltransferase [Marinobacter changyiensis]